jgi:hypothetical protein
LAAPPSASFGTGTVTDVSDVLSERRRVTVDPRHVAAAAVRACTGPRQRRAQAHAASSALLAATAGLFHRRACSQARRSLPCRPSWNSPTTPARFILSLSSRASWHSQSTRTRPAWWSCWQLCTASRHYCPVGTSPTARARAARHCRQATASRTVDVLRSAARSASALRAHRSRSTYPNGVIDRPFLLPHST